VLLGLADVDQSGTEGQGSDDEQRLIASWLAEYLLSKVNDRRSSKRTSTDALMDEKKHQ
jgi:hypothetical protein